MDAAPDQALVIAPKPVLPLDRHPVAVYLAGLARGSRRAQRTALRTIAKLASHEANEMTLPWWMLDYAHTSAIRAKLAETFAPNTANRMLAAMRGVLKAAFKLGLMDSDHMARACSVAAVRGTRVVKGRALSRGELTALFEVCDGSTPGGARNAALLGLLYGGGLRRAEVVALARARKKPRYPVSFHRGVVAPRAARLARDRPPTQQRRGDREVTQPA